MSDVLVKVDGVSKKFCKSLKKSLWYGIQDLGREIAGRNTGGDRLRPDEFWAVNDVSFEIKRGECLGLIGRNGAGKTTLLRMLNGLIKPDTGSIEIRGRVGALISLGAGFNTILSGRENIYNNGSILGFSNAEIERKFEEIVDFSELSSFIDMPVQHYSSGMIARLGFAIASAMEPDVLLLDEILAVGDAAFRAKCYNKIANIRKNTAVIFVSHNMDQIARTASQGLLLTSGRTTIIGELDSCINEYERQNSLDGEIGFLKIYSPVTEFYAELSTTELSSGNSLNIGLNIISLDFIRNYILKVIIYDQSGNIVADGTIVDSLSGIEIKPNANFLNIFLSNLCLKNGKYFLSFNLIDCFGDLIVWSYKTHVIYINSAYSGAISSYQIQIELN